MSTEKATKTTTKKITVKETKPKATPKKAEPKKVAPKTKRVVVDRNTEVVFMNNTSGNLFYKCPRTHATYDLYEYGDIDYITVEQLLTMNNTSRTMLNDLWVLLLDTTDEDVEIDDVLKYLGIDKLYNDIIRPEDVDKFITESTDDNFKTALEKMSKALATRVVERSADLHKSEMFNSLAKLNALKELTGNEDLFE